MTSKRNVSIIIPTLNSPHLSACIRAVRGQSGVDLIKEIIIVGQQDKLNIEQEEHLTFISVEDQPTVARNRNIGAKSARGEWLAFIDADCVPEMDWLANLVEAIPEQSQIIGGAVRVPKGMSYWGRCFHLLAFGNQAFEAKLKSTLIPYTAGLNLFTRLDIFISSGGFDETFGNFTGEDFEWCYRMKNVGHQIIFAKNAVVEHRHSRHTLEKSWNRMLEYGRGMVTVRQRFPKRFWNIWFRLAKFRILGELIGFMWVINRAIIRFTRFRQLISFSPFYPGIILLDLGFTLGMIKAIRDF